MLDVVGTYQKQWRGRRRRTAKLHKLRYRYVYGGKPILEKLGYDTFGV